MKEDQPYLPQAVTLEEAWVRARNTWMLAQRHGTLEEGDVMAVGELRRHVKLIDEGGVPLDVVNKAINAAVADASNGARQTAEYWKAEHLAGNDRIAALERGLTQAVQMYTDAAGERDKALADLAAAQAVLPCGHHHSLMLESAETGEPLYCELCDCISRRNDAETMEAEARAEAAALLALLIRYRNEVPLGHQPHMIAHLVDAAIDAARKESGNG